MTATTDPADTPSALAPIGEYFELAPSADTAAYFALFADDAVVRDDGGEYRGIEAIRAWRSSVPSVTYSVDDVRSSDDRYLAHVDIAGDFPGSPVRLGFLFQFAANNQITELTISP